MLATRVRNAGERIRSEIETLPLAPLPLASLKIGAKINNNAVSSSRSSGSIVIFGDIFDIYFEFFTRLCELQTNKKEGYIIHSVFREIKKFILNFEFLYSI